MQTSKAYISLFLLFLFLFPQLEKGIHDWHHGNDNHCKTKQEYHFHEEEHSCSLCDYSIPLIKNSIIEQFNIITRVYTPYNFTYTEHFTFSDTGTLLPPRAPPTV
jgi:hypothetical protein